MEQYECWLAFRETLTNARKRKCLEYFGSAETIFIASAAQIETAPFLREEEKRELILSRTERELMREQNILSSLGMRFVGRSEEAYPERLKYLLDAPAGLFVLGRLPDPKKTAVALVGARYATGEGCYTAREAAAALAGADVEVISGMATGIDGEAQEAALDAGGRSYAVLGCGGDICYPKNNKALYQRLKEEGGILSEYPPGTEPKPYYFPERNRIISGLSDVVLVVEARKKSGSLITASLALDQGRDVFAVPGRIHDSLSEGCNELIRQGAGIFCSPGSFLLDLGLEGASGEKEKKNQLLLAKSENMVYSCVDLRGKSLDELSRSSGLSVSDTIKALTTLQIQELVEKKAGLYRRKKQSLSK